MATLASSRMMAANSEVVVATRPEISLPRKSVRFGKA